MIDQREVQELLEGNFKLNHQPSSRAIRLYLSSEFADTTQERAHVVRDVFPLLHAHSKALGLQFHGVDLYNAVPSSLKHTLLSPPKTGDVEALPCNGETGKDPGSPRESGLIYLLEREGLFTLASDEIKRCQSLSAGPNFITLLAQRYGFKPLRSRILQADFELIQAAVEESSAKSLLKKWYKLDSNATPPEYLLQYPKRMKLAEWIEVHDSLSKTLRKAARVALGKDVAKVQHFVMSAVEEEITQGIFHLRQNPNQCCFWFKRVFTDLLDQRTSDTSLESHTDMIPGKKGAEFDPESLKALNHLKEARLPAKYIGLDSTNIFEFHLKWQRGSGLDPVENSAHEDYLQQLCSEIATTLKTRISAAAETLEEGCGNSTCQEVMQHSAYCKKKAKTFMDRPALTERLYNYINSGSHSPMVLYGETGSGKTHLMASTAHKMRERFPLKNMILVTRFIGISPQSFSIRNTLRSVCQQLSALLKENDLVPADFSSITACFKSLLALATSDRPIYILLDGVDQLSPEDGASGMSWLPLQLPPHVKIILSTSSEAKYRCYPVLQSLLAKQPENMTEIPPLRKEECRALLKHQLSLWGRTLTADQETAVMMVLRHCPLPLCVDLLVIEVREWASYFKPWQTKAPPTTLKDIAVKLFLGMERRYGKTLFSSLAGYITASKHGLTEMELLDVLACNQQVMENINKEWTVRSLVSGGDANETSSHLLSSIPAMLWSRVYRDLLPITELVLGAGGHHVIRWSHRYFSELAASRYLHPKCQARIIYRHLADYFSGKSVLDTAENKTTTEEGECAATPFCPQPLLLNVEECRYNVRKFSELPHCLARSGQRKELQDLLTDYHWLKGKIAVTSCGEVVEEFSAVLPVVPLQRSEADSGSFYELRLLRDALSLSVAALNLDPTQLPAQLYGRLIPVLAKKETKRPVLEKLVMCALEDSQSLLTPLQPLQHLPGGPLLLTMKGHRDAISDVAAASLVVGEGEKRQDSTLCLVSSSWDKTLKSWDLATTGVLKTFDGHTGRVLCVALTRDGQYAASGSEDTTVRLWYVSMAECVHVMTGHTAAVNAVVLATDGTKTISGSADSTIKVWNTDINSSSRGEIIYTIKVHCSPVLSMCLFQDQLLASGAKNSVTLVTDVVSGGVLHTYKGQDGAVTAVSVTLIQGSEQYLLAGARSGSVCVWLVGSGQLVHSLKRPDQTGSRVNSITVTDGGKITVSYDNGALSVWDLLTGAHLYQLRGPQQQAAAAALGLALADEGGLLVAGCRDSSLQIWDLLSSPVLQERQHQTEVSCVSVSPCGTYGVSGGVVDSKVRLYHLRQCSVMGEIDTMLEGVTRVLVLRDSERIVLASREGDVQMWNGATREHLATFRDPDPSPVTCMAVSPDSSLLMCGREDSEVGFWSVKTGAKLKKFCNHSAALVEVGFARDCMVSASQDGLVCVRDYHTAKITLSLPTCVGDVLLCLAVSPNAAFFVAGYSSKACRVIDMRSGLLKCVLQGHGGPVTCVRVMSTCTRCLTGCEDGSLRVWEVEEGGACVGILCTDSPLTSCDISWKGDSVLYGTRGGWVSTAACGDAERARGRVLECESLSSVSCSGSESISAVESTAQEDAVGGSKSRFETQEDLGRDVPEQADWQNDIENAEPMTNHTGFTDTDGEFKASPKNLDMPSQLKDTSHLAEKHEIENVIHPQELLPDKKERVRIVETATENAMVMKEQNNITSSTCTIV